MPAAVAVPLLMSYATNWASVGVQVPFASVPVVLSLPEHLTQPVWPTVVQGRRPKQQPLVLFGVEPEHPPVPGKAGVLFWKGEDSTLPAGQVGAGLQQKSPGLPGSSCRS